MTILRLYETQAGWQDICVPKALALVVLATLYHVQIPLYIALHTLPLPPTQTLTSPTIRHHVHPHTYTGGAAEGGTSTP